MPTPRTRTPLTARTADKHVLYEEAVQAPEAEVDFMTRVYRARHRRGPVRLREDFCGTAANSCEWVKRGRGHEAIGVDLDRPTLLEHSRRHTGTLTADQRARLRLVHANVLSPALARARVDAVLALNFSYWVFKERATMLAYFRRVRRALSRGGVFILDFFGGSDVHSEVQDRRRCKGFTYVWDQAHYEPLSGDYTCHIHFEFPGGTVIRRAFTYHWRLWTMPELRDLLHEAGFADVETYAEGTTKSGKGDGVFKKRDRHPCDRSFLAYLVAWK